MDNVLIDQIALTVENACKSESNIFGYGIWTHHIKPMISIAQELAKQYKADIEIVTIATLLHDLAGIKDDTKSKEHHIYGAADAEMILRSYDYPESKIEIIKKCIYNHRGSVNNQKGSPEEICVADADAIAHITEIASLFYVAYKERNMDIDQGRQWIKDKIKRDWDKMSEKGQLKFKEKYDQICNVL